ncbi:MAG: 23S rRNA (uracil(1939)-C(5))-methyltransferase RlmD [Faecalibacterium sp.]
MNQALSNLHPSAYPLIHMEYTDQLTAKSAKMTRLFGQFGKECDTIYGMKKPFAYKNKLTASFGRGKTGKLVTGDYSALKGKVFAVESYPMHDAILDKALVAVRAAANFCKYEPYNAESGRGMVRAVVLRRGVQSGQVMVILVTGKAILPGAKNFVSKLRTLCKNQNIEVSTVVQNVNEWQTNLILGEREKVLFGKGFIVEPFCGKTYAISPGGYFPDNAAQTETLYKIALKQAALSGAETVFNLYCGMGALALTSSMYAARILAVDSNEASVQDGIGNAHHNGVGNIRFYAENPIDWLEGQRADGAKPDVILLEPPRAQLDTAMLSAILDLAPNRIVYIAHSPEEQVKDIAAMVKKGYRVASVTPVDLAPYTNYISGVIALERTK